MFLSRESQEPHLRYQTSPKVKETVSKKLVDVADDGMREKQMKFFHEIVDY